MVRLRPANFPNSDVISCTLDTDAGTLTYSINGERSGVALHHLPRGQSLRPWAAVFVGARGDSVSISPCYSFAIDPER